jgi:hypothetical protein
VTLTTDLEQLTDRLTDRGLFHEVGQAAKAVALDLIERDTGGDRQLSGIRRRARLGAGYDLQSTGVQLNLYPRGLWVIVSEGRRGKAYKNIPRRNRRRRRGRHALATPAGPRYSAAITRSRGKGTLDDLETRLDEVVPDTVDRWIR